MEECADIQQSKREGKRKIVEETSKEQEEVHIHPHRTVFLQGLAKSDGVLSDVPVLFRNPDQSVVCMQHFNTHSHSFFFFFLARSIHSSILAKSIILHTTTSASHS